MTCGRPTESRWRTSVFAAARRSATVMSSVSRVTNSPSKMYLSRRISTTRRDPHDVVVVPTLHGGCDRSRASTTLFDAPIATVEELLGDYRRLIDVMHSR